MTFKQNIEMEYKYRFLNPPVSTASIDFKLSQTHLDTYTFLSPSKPKDSLTYTISIQTIQDENFKSPNRFQNLPSVMELEYMECRESMKPEENENVCDFVSLARIGSEKFEEELIDEQLLEKVQPSILRLVQCKDIEINEKLRSKSKKQEVIFGKMQFSKQKNIKNKNFEENQQQKFVPKVKKAQKQRSISKYQENYGSSKFKKNHNLSMINEILKAKGYQSHGKESYENKNQIEKRNSLIKTSSSSYVNSPDIRKQKQNKKQIKCQPMRPSSPQIGNQKFGIKCYAINRKQIKTPSKFRKRIFSDFTINKTVSSNYQIETAKNRSRYGSVRESPTKLSSNAPNYKIDCLSIIAVKMNLRQRQKTYVQNTKSGKESEGNANEKQKGHILYKCLENKRQSLIGHSEEINMKRLVKVKFQSKLNMKSMSLHA